MLARGAAELPVDGLGIDFYATHLDDVPEGFDKLLLAGVLDARNSLAEEPRKLAAFVEKLRERGVERIALVPNGDLQYVSEPYAREKLTRLGKARTATVEAAAWKFLTHEIGSLAKPPWLVKTSQGRELDASESSTRAAGARRSASKATKSWSSRSSAAARASTS